MLKTQALPPPLLLLLPPPPLLLVILPWMQPLLQVMLLHLPPVPPIRFLPLGMQDTQGMWLCVGWAG